VPLLEDLELKRNKLVNSNSKLNLPPVKPLSDEWFVLQFLKNWTADDIRLAIKKNVDLAELMLKHPREAEPLKKIAEKHDPSSVTVGDILYWFSIRRPDLYKAIVEDRRGIEWVARNAVNLKRILASNI